MSVMKFSREQNKKIARVNPMCDLLTLLYRLGLYKHFNSFSHYDAIVQHYIELPWSSRS